MFKRGDIVIVTCEHPTGIFDISTKGQMGVITKVSAKESEDTVYKVQNTANTFLYFENDLRLATAEEKEEKLVNLLLLFTKE